MKCKVAGCDKGYDEMLREKLRGYPKILALWVIHAYELRNYTRTIDEMVPPPGGEYLEIELNFVLDDCESNSIFWDDNHWREVKEQWSLLNSTGS